MTRKTDVTQLIDFTKQNISMFDFGVVSNSLDYTGLSQNEGLNLAIGLCGPEISIPIII